MANPGVTYSASIVGVTVDNPDGANVLVIEPDGQGAEITQLVVSSSKAGVVSVGWGVIDYPAEGGPGAGSVSLVSVAAGGPAVDSGPLAWYGDATTDVDWKSDDQDPILTFRVSADLPLVVKLDTPVILDGDSDRSFYIKVTPDADDASVCASAWLRLA